MNANERSISEFRTILRKLEREIDIELKGETSCCGVTLSQCHILMELSDHGETSIKTLSESFGLDKSTLSRTIDGMVEAGLIVRKTNKNDRRFYDLSLTETGAEKAGYINDQCNIYYKELLKNIPAKKHPMIMESVMLLATSMKSLRSNKKDASCCTVKMEE
jgi:DNA-binding MarR family transcriptional regulator